MLINCIYILSHLGYLEISNFPGERKYMLKILIMKVSF